MRTIGINYGKFNAHQKTIDITFDEGKRVTLEGSGLFTAYDEAPGDWRITAWLKALFGSASVQHKNAFATNKLLLDDDTGYSAGRAALTEAQLFYHRDGSMYDFSVVTWANDSNTSPGEPGASTRLENVMICVKRII